MPSSWTVIGFRTVRKAHAHLLKHLLQLTEVSDSERGPARDAEAWQEVIGDPPLVADLSRRRLGAEASLAKVAGCVAGKAGVTGGKPCDLCQDPTAMAVVSSEMSNLLTRYVAAGQAALDAAFSNPDRNGPRLVLYGGPQGTTVETVDSRHVRVVGRVLAEDEVELVTCYRDRSRSLHSWWLELARLRAAHRRAGTLDSVG